MEQSQIVNIFQMFSSGLHSTGSVLMSFNSNVCPSLRAVGQAQLSTQTCICVIASAKGFLSALIPHGFKKVAVCAFSFYSVFLIIPHSSSTEGAARQASPTFFTGDGD